MDQFGPTLGLLRPPLGWARPSLGLSPSRLGCMRPTFDWYRQSWSELDHLCSTTFWAISAKIGRVSTQMRARSADLPALTFGIVKICGHVLGEAVLNLADATQFRLCVSQFWRDVGSSLESSNEGTIRQDLARGLSNFGPDPARSRQFPWNVAGFGRVGSHLGHSRPIFIRPRPN